MLNNLSIQKRLLVMTFIPVLLFIASTLFTLFELKKIIKDLDYLYEDRVLPMQEIKIVSDDYAVVIVDTFHKLRGNMITASDAISTITKARKVANENWRKYELTHHTNQENQLIEQAQKAREKVDLLIDSYIQQIRNDTFMALPYDRFVKETYETFDPLSESYNELIELQVNEAKKLKDDGDHEAEVVTVTLIVLSIFICVLMFVIGFLIYRSIQLALQSMGKTLTHVASTNDLTQRFDIKGENELSDIAENFNLMMDKFHNILTNISNMTESLSHSSQELSESGIQISTSVEEQEQQTCMIAQAITQMNSANEEVASNANNTSSSTNKVDELAQSGQKTIEDGIESIKNLADLVVNNSSLIGKLNNQTNEINQVVLMIQGVAEQTNLLALNAAIEAARAGDSGRGFAVVADEVRTLAHNTQKATESISEMISKLQSQASNVVSAMSNAEEKALMSVEYSKTSANTILEISDAVSHIADMNMQVSTATEQQSCVTGQISKSIESFNVSISEVTKNAQINASASQELATMAERLQSEIACFKV